MERLSQIEEIEDQISDLIEIHEILKDPLYLYAWLKYCDFRVSYAAKAIKESFKWREEIQALNINDLEPPQGLAMSFNEITKDGVLIACIDLTEMDPRRTLTDLGSDHCFRFAMSTAFQIEKRLMKHCSACKPASKSQLSDVILEKAFKQLYVIFNVSSVTFYQVRSFQVIKYALDIANAYIKYFPAPASHLVCVKASRPFSIIFNVLEPILRSTLKIEVHHNPEKWLEKIKDQISLSQLPVSLGGTQFLEQHIVSWRARHASNVRPASQLI